MATFNRDFKGVWIPKNIWLDKKLKKTDKKVLLNEIHSLDNENGCYASNHYFSEFMDVSERTISRYIKELVDDKYITAETDVVWKGGGQAFERIIRCLGELARKPEKDLFTYEDVEVDGVRMVRKVRQK